MPRRPRVATGGLAYHVLNRAIGRVTLIESEADYAAFEGCGDKRGRESFID